MLLIIFTNAACWFQESYRAAAVRRWWCFCHCQSTARWSGAHAPVEQPNVWLFSQWSTSCGKAVLGQTNQHGMVGLPCISDLGWSAVTAEFQKRKATFQEICQDSWPTLEQPPSIMKSLISVGRHAAIAIRELFSSDSYKSVGNNFGFRETTMVGSRMSEVNEEFLFTLSHPHPCWCCTAEFRNKRSARNEGRDIGGWQ